MSARYYKLPDPYTPLHPYGLMPTTAAPSAGGTGTANKAFYVPCVFPADCTLYAIRFQAGNGTGNYDLGLYDDEFRRLASSGSTAMTAAGTKSLTLSEMRVRAGRVYYGALALSSTSGSALRRADAVVDVAFLGLYEETSALPLPATATPVFLTAAFQPIFSFGVR